MGTYDYDKVVSDYATGRMNVEMAMGHSLQHIGKLYEAQTTAEANHRELQGKVNNLAYELETLRAEINRLQKQQAKTNRLQTLENNLTALNMTVYQLKDEVDNLKAHPSNADEIDPSARNQEDQF